ncbi:hypothetical protein WCLE_008750 [Wolbachia endosymbiont of Cimex lectularius]|nr:hypothetical protein WCLE_008750 [Wolbachia endosymbiont of Cimex lectularius]
MQCSYNCASRAGMTKKGGAGMIGGGAEVTRNGLLE